jgi:two-component system response regulator HydG
MSHILIVEDEALIRSSLKRLLERHDYTISEAGSVADACERYSLDEFDLIISDVRLPGEPGTVPDRQGQTDTPVLIMTSFGSMKAAVDAMKQGAVDYISKPFDHDEMLLTIERILRETALVTQNEALKQEVARTFPHRHDWLLLPPCKKSSVAFARSRHWPPPC